MSVIAKVGESWFVRLPGELNLRKSRIEYITAKVVTISYQYQGLSVTSTYLKSDISLVEECAQ